MKTIIALLVVCCCSCGTVFNESISSIQVTSSTPGAVYIDGNRRGATPTTLQLASKLSHTIVVKTPDGREGSCQLTSTAGAGWIILDIVLGVLPLVVDAITGGWNALDKTRCDINVQ